MASLGVDWREKPALDRIDEQIGERFDHKGFFVEAGGNDGCTQSNTYWLEKSLGWKGILIEPIPYLAAQCRQRRLNSQVFEAALGRPEDQGSLIELRYGYLCTSQPRPWEDVSGGFGNIPKWMNRHKSYNATATTLTHHLDAACATANISFLSLDVEEVEHAILSGIDFNE